MNDARSRAEAGRTLVMLAIGATRPIEPDPFNEVALVIWICNEMQP